MIKISTFIFNAFQENTYILYDDTGECVIVDAGVSTNHEKKLIEDYISTNRLCPVALLNTHCHIDHIFGCNYLKAAYSIPFYIHKEDLILVEKAKEFAAVFGYEMDKPPQPDKFLIEGGEFSFGKSGLKIIHVPGHSPGSICFYSENDRFIITGDVLFDGSIGRTDLPGGDYDTLITGIKAKLLVLPRDVMVYPGHGPTTTIGQEQDSNPFLN